jgi:Domain of unknown function (DUF4157)
MESSELQTAPPEHESRTHEKAAVSREHVNDNSAAPLDRFFGGASAESQNGSAVRLLRSPSLLHSATDSVRAIAFKRVHQTHGNRFAQLALAGRVIQRHCSCGGTCEKCRTEEDALTNSPVESSEESTRLVQREPDTSSSLRGTESNAEGVIPPGNGEPLDERTRNFMESGFGAEFSDVRIHTDSRAAESAEALSANAYTTGRDIYFGCGRYAPETTEGQHLLAHELTHTIQQSGVLASSQSAMRASEGVMVGPVDDPLEQEADRAADVVVNGKGNRALSPQATTSAITPTVQCQETPADKPPEQPGKFPPQEEPKHGKEKEDEEKDKAVKGGLKAAGEFSKRFWEEFSSSDLGKSVLAANKRDWQSVIKFFEDFWSTAFGKLVLSGLGAGGATGLFAAGRAARDAEAASAISPDAPPRAGSAPKDEKFVALELNWDFVTPPKDVTLKTPWLDLPKIGGPSGGGSPAIPPPPRLIVPGQKIPRICTPADPQGDTGEAAARDAQIYSWLLWKQHQERERMNEILRQNIRAPGEIWQPSKIPRISGSALSPIKPLFKRAPGANGCERERYFLADSYAPSNFPLQEGMTRQSFAVQRQAGIIPGSLTLGPSPPARPLPPHVPEAPRAAGHGATVTVPPSSTGPTCWTGDICSRPAPGSASEFSSQVAQQQAQGPQNPARPSATAVLQFANAAAPGLLASAAKVVVNPNIRDTAGAQADPSTRTIEVPTALEREASEFNASPPAATVGGRSRADWSFNTVRILTHEMAHIRFTLAPPSGLPKVGDVALSELDELNALLSEFPLGYRHVMSMGLEEEVKAQRIDTAIATYIEKRGEGIRGILTKLRCVASCDDVNTSVRRVFEAQTASWPQQVRDVLLSALADPSNRLQWPMPPPPRAGLPPAPRSAGMGGIQRSTNPLVAMLPPRLQLTVSKSGDVHEQEADRVADTVMRMPSASGTIQRHCSCGGTCDKCKQDEERRTIQRKSEGEGPAEFQGVPNTQGKPLATESQSRLQTHFGADLSDVRVHTSSEASASAASLDALAYTSGRDIYFARGMYAPSTSSGDRLLAHEVAHVVQQSSGKEPLIAMKSAGGVKIGAPDDGLEIQADQSAEEYIRGGASAREEEHQKLPAPQSPAPIQRAPKPAPQSSQPAADPAVVQNAVDAVCKGIDDDSVDAVVAPMRGLSISAAASLRSGVLMRKTVLLERWLLKPHGDQKTLEDIASIALITTPVVIRTRITATAEEGLRLLWPALPLIDRLEIYDEGFREIEQAQLDVIRQGSLKERADAQKQATQRLLAVYSKMSAKEEFEARNLMDSSEVAKGDTAVRMIERGDKDVVYDAVMALDRIDRKFVWDQHYMQLKDLLNRDQFNLVAALTHGSEAQMIIARLRLATEDRDDDMEAVRAMVDRAVALLTERQQLREARSARLLTADDRARIDERLQELDDLDVLLQFKRTAKGNLKENTFMALLADAENKQAAFGSHMDRLAQFSSNRRAFALEAAKQRVLIAGSNQDELRSILLTTHAPVDPKDKTKRTDLKQWEEDIEFRKELLSDPQVHKVFVGLVGSEQMHVRTALKGDAFDDKLERLNQMKNAALWGEFFDLIRTVARNDEWRMRFEKTKTEYWSLYAFVSGEEREIMETILHDPEHRIPIIKLLRYTGKVSTLKAAFAHLQENEREQLRTGWAMANHPFIGPRTEPQDSALAAFRQFEGELKKSQGSDKEGYETVLATVLGTAPTKSEMATGQGRYNAAAILAERVAKRLGLARGIAADFTETDETMDAAGRQFAALWLRLKDQPELSIVEYATLSTLYQQFEHRAEEFSEAAKAITDMAGTIAATLAGIVVVVATGGAAGPAVVAMAATAGAAGGFVAREAFGGDYYTAMSSEGERALLLDSINGALAVLSGSLAARGVELMGLSGRALAQGMVQVGEGAVQEAAQSLGRKALVSGVEAALDGLISGTISEAAVTFTDDRTWREGIMEGLARVGKSALLGGLFGLAGGAVLGSAMPVVGRAVGGLRKALTAGSLEKSLIRAGMGDILKTAQAAARSGDTHAVEMLINQMEGHLAAEDAALLRQQLREELTQVLEHPPGRAEFAKEQEALLKASGAKEEGLAQAELEAELDVVSRSEPQISTEHGYVDEVDLGNGHTWRRTEEGTWCRFTKKSLCGTKIPSARKMSAEALERAQFVDEVSKALDALADTAAGAAATSGRKAATKTIKVQDAINGALRDMKGKWSGHMAEKGTKLHAALARRLEAMGLPAKVNLQVEQKLKNVYKLPSNIEKMSVRDWLRFEGKGGGRAHAWLADQLEKRVLDTAVGNLELDAIFTIDGRTIVFDLTTRQETSHLAKTTLYTVIGSEENQLYRVQEYYWAAKYE